MDLNKKMFIKARKNIFIYYVQSLIQCLAPIKGVISFSLSSSLSHFLPKPHPPIPLEPLTEALEATDKDLELQEWLLHIWQETEWKSGQRGLLHLLTKVAVGVGRKPYFYHLKLKVRIHFPIELYLICIF